MAINNNPQAIHIDNEQIRPLADRMAQLYYLAKLIGQESVAQNWNGNYFATDVDTVGDGAALDGRILVTNGALKIVTSLAAAIVTDFEANSALKLNQILAVAVNPQP